MSAKMVEKIAKLIAKAENAVATPEEAAAFMAKAEELMLLTDWADPTTYEVDSTSIPDPSRKIVCGTTSFS